MKVLCIGQMVADVIVSTVPSFSFEEDTTWVDSITLKNGGDALNTAVDLGRLGIPCGIASRIGGDVFGDVLLEAARKAGVYVDRVKRSEKNSTAVAVTLVREDGERVFLYAGASLNDFSANDVDESLLDEAEIVHFGGVYNLPSIEERGIPELLAGARRRGARTSLDVTWDHSGKWLSTIEGYLPLLDFFLPSVAEAGKITGLNDPVSICHELLSRGVGCVALKLGPQGCLIMSDSEEIRVPAAPVRKVVDTTGAGDAFVAGFLAGLVKQWPLRDCGALGNAVGAMAVERFGATDGVTSFSDALTKFEMIG